MPDDETPVSAPAEGAASSEEAPAKPRRRRRTKAEMEAARAAEAAAKAAAEAAGEPWPPKRRRGRPRKSETAAAEAASAAGEKPAGTVEAEPKPAPEAAPAAPSSHEGAAPRRRRGRPRKAEAAPADAPAEASAPEETSSSDKMTRLTQEAEATRASSEPTTPPATTLAEAAPAEAPSDPASAPAAEAPRTEGEQPRSGRKRRRPGDHAAAPSAPEAPEHTSGKPNGNGFQSPRRQNGFQNSRRRNGRRQDVQAEPSLSREELGELKVTELRAKATELGIEYAGVRKPELVEAIFVAAARAEGFRPIDGILEIGNEGYGWIRTGNYMEGDGDAFVHQQMIRGLGLRPGDRVVGTVGPGRSNSKYPPLQSVSTVNGQVPENLKARPRFRDLTPVFPNERLVMECGKDSITGRAIDLVSPIGKGQRGLIVSPPKAGKTTVLKKICQSIAANNPEVHLFCLLVDERPEEVTDMQRSIKGEVVASTFDMPAENHTHVSELVIEHAKRLVELGEDVVVVLDSITRLARAYNLAQPASGRILSGGVDSAALYPPKKFLGAARNIENGGSLTIIASALVDTGSKMDEVIFEEFKGTGNMELKLDRDLADRRIFPAIDPISSGTRNEDLLISPEYQPLVWGIRRMLANMNNTERAANALVNGLKGTASNEDFLIRSAKKAQQSGYVG